MVTTKFAQSTASPMPRPRKSSKPRKSAERLLRERVFGQIASPDNSAEVTIKNMDAYIHWIKTGKSAVQDKPRLRVVEARND